MVIGRDEPSGTITVVRLSVGAALLQNGVFITNSWRSYIGLGMRTPPGAEAKEHNKNEITYQDG